MFINLSNHPSIMWGEKQRNTAQIWGRIQDIPFPRIDPEFTDDALDKLVEDYAGKIAAYRRPETSEPFVVMVQGEFVFCYRMVTQLKKQGIKVVAAQSRRIVAETLDENGNYVKESHFEFVKFREY